MTNGWLDFQAKNDQMIDHLSYDNKTPFWICDLSSYNGFKLLGDKSEQFLQGQVTCDVNQVNNSKITLGSLCDYKGRVYAIFYLYYWQNNYYLWMPHDIIENTITQLNKYAVFSKVTLHNQTDDLVAIGIGGTQCDQYLSPFLQKKVPKEINECAQTDQYLLIKIADEPQRYMMIGAISEIQKFWQLFRQQAVHVAANIWQLHNIFAGIPMIHSATINLFTPHQLNLPTLNAVSFNKGCYTGQEIVARTQYLGKLKQHLYRALLSMPTQPPPAEKIFITSDNNIQHEIGYIVNAASNENNICHLLVVLQDNAIASLPFIDHQNIKYFISDILNLS